MANIKLADLSEDSQITLLVRNADNQMEIRGFIKRFVKSDIALIALDYEPSKRLNFDNVKVDMEYCHEDGVPYMWRDIKIVSYKGDYVIQVFSDGEKYNRRDSFRVGVSSLANLLVGGRSVDQVIVKDISMTGFAIADKEKRLNFSSGDEVHIYFEDVGHLLNLIGRVVRIEERENMIIYGLEIRNLCKDLQSYISVKQRRGVNSR